MEVALTISIGGIFGIRLNQSSAEATLASTTATLCGRGLSQVLVGWLPGIGNICNAATAAIVLQLVGWAVAMDFDSRAKAPTKGKEKEVEKNGGHKKS
jgi:uncharacterized protein (DUF697 family)